MKLCFKTLSVHALAVFTNEIKSGTRIYLFIILTRVSYKKITSGVFSILSLVKISMTAFCIECI